MVWEIVTAVGASNWNFDMLWFVVGELWKYLVSSNSCWLLHTNIRVALEFDMLSGWDFQQKAGSIYSTYVRMDQTLIRASCFLIKLWGLYLAFFCSRSADIVQLSLYLTDLSSMPASSVIFWNNFRICLFLYIDWSTAFSILF